MKKIGAVVAITVGALIIILNLLLLLAWKKYINIDVFSTYIYKNSLDAVYKNTYIGYWITIILGILMLILGLLSWHKPKSFSSLVLLLIYGILIGLTINRLINLQAWSIINIIILIINFIGALGSLSALIKVKRHK